MYPTAMQPNIIPIKLIISENTFNPKKNWLPPLYEELNILFEAISYTSKNEQANIIIEKKTTPH